MWKIIIWEPHDFKSINSITDHNYQYTLWLLPTLRDEIEKRVSILLSIWYSNIKKSEIYDNSNIIENDSLESRKKLLIRELEELERMVRKEKFIHIFTDDCFTNSMMIETISSILWYNNFKKYVKVNSLDLTEKYDENDFLIEDNSLIILWWSLNDTHTIDSSYYNWWFADFIKKLSNDFYIEPSNNRLIWICFWQQFIANLLWMWNNSSSFVATYKWYAQFWPSNCKVINYSQVNDIYKEALYWITDYWLNDRFSTFFTRSWYVDFDFLWSWKEISSVVPLIKDEITNTIVWWWTKNWNILWVQFHPEISFFQNREFLEKNISEIIPYLHMYRDYDRLYDNFNFNTWFPNIKNDIWESFYTYSILAYLKSIKESYKEINIHIQRPTLYRDIQKRLSYEEFLKELQDVIRNKVDYILSTWNRLLYIDQKERLSFLSKIDESWKLILNHKLDWKVNRWIDEVSSVLWIKSLPKILLEHIKILQDKEQIKRVYVFRDWWAWDWTLLKQMYTECHWNDIIFYWVWDYVYYDIFPIIKQKSEKLWIPYEVGVLFFEIVIKEYNNLLNKEEENSKMTVKTKIEKVLNTLDIFSQDVIHKSSITSEETMMFSSEWEKQISEESKQYIVNNYEKIELLSKHIISNLYESFEGYFERIFISKFNDFYISNKRVSNVDFQVSIRATSHVYNREYMKILFDYINISSFPRSIYIDNWVHRSYTWVPRIKELYEIQQIFSQDIKIKLIYDTNTNYFTSAIIQRRPFHDDDFFLQNLREWYIIISIEEAYKTTFFKLERYIREFIVKNFRNYNVFWDFNRNIIYTLKQIIIPLNKWDINTIKISILNLINYIASNYKDWENTYNQINLDILDKYDIDWEKIEDIVKDIYIPDWVELSASRKY